MFYDGVCYKINGYKICYDCHDYAPCTSIVRYLVDDQIIYGKSVYPKDLEHYVEVILRLMRGG